jgi:hypothetical protein
MKMKTIAGLAAVATGALLVVAAAGLTSGAEAAAPAKPATFVLQEVWSTWHDGESGAVQDSHWSYDRKADPLDPCSTAESGRGQQKIVFHKPSKLVLLTFYPKPGLVWPMDITLPAKATRTATHTETPPADTSTCGAAGQGDGTQPTLPATQGGCGTLPGTVSLHLAIKGGALEISGQFTPYLGASAFSGCPLFIGSSPTPPENGLAIIPTTWVLPSTLYAPKPLGINIDDALGHPGNAVVTRRTTGSTVTSIWLFLARTNHAPVHP